jgi:TPR repeat protein
MLDDGEGFEMHKSLAAHYYQLSADQKFAEAHFSYGNMFNRVKVLN